jgi:2-C-methyl-D-erythritol 4-phosphate cytidylyltransferase
MGGVKKEYRLLSSAPADGACAGDDARGMTVLGAAVSAFAAVPAVAVIVIAVPPDAQTGEAAARNALPPELPGDAVRPRIVFVSGGSCRRESVYHALSRLVDYRPRYVLIHDGARPWISPGLIERVIAAVKKYGAVIPLLPLTETPKETCTPFDAAYGTEDSAGPVFIKRQLKRAVTGLAQTPQAFAFPAILRAHERAAVCVLTEDAEYTDDAEVWAAFNGPVAVIPGSPENRKITFPEDLP